MEENKVLTDEQKKKIKEQIEDFSRMCIKTCSAMLKDNNVIRTMSVMTLLETTLYLTNKIINEIFTKKQRKGENK